MMRESQVGPVEKVRVQNRALLDARRTLMAERGQLAERVLEAALDLRCVGAFSWAACDAAWPLHRTTPVPADR